MAKRASGGQGAPPRDRLQEAARLVFTQGPEAALDTHFRYVCWGLREPRGQPPRSILDDLPLLTRTAAAIEAAARREPILARDWRGLLDAYFRCDVNHGSHRRLRETLAVTLPRVRRGGFVPDWLTLLDAHPDLLGDAPTRAYAEEVLAGRTAVVDRLRVVLGIPPESWFWRTLLLDQVATVCARDGARFRIGMEALLPQLAEKQYDLVRDRALARFLDRYQQSQERAKAHTGLKDAALRWWGSPHLLRNSRWGLVRPETKKMVGSWLTVQALHDFFHLLQEDRRADERRLRFWLRYQQSIESFHFALGPLVHDSHEPDYKRLRDAYREHFSKLESAGSPRNNAFILGFGGYSIVEFGVTGHACYCYRRDNLPFQFDLGHQSIALPELKSPFKMECRLVHMGEWELNFARELAQRGISPDPGASPLVADARQSTWRPVGHPGPTGETMPRFAEAPAGLDALIQHVRQRGIPVDDGRPRSVLWVNHLPDGDELARLLKAHGFRHYAARGWWRY
ncbi:MAG: EH signature domain-containing protein [Thermodesulfobacteriota bacterium]